MTPVIDPLGNLIAGLNNPDPNPLSEAIARLLLDEIWALRNAGQTDAQVQTAMLSTYGASFLTVVSSRWDSVHNDTRLTLVREARLPNRKI